MPTRIDNRRADTRHELLREFGVEIEFCTPNGERNVFPLKELCIGGASFEIPRRVEGIDSGAPLADAVIRLGRLEVRANLVVIHMLRGYGPDYTVGVQLYPKTESDRNELIDLTARLESLPKLSEE